MRRNNIAVENNRKTVIIIHYIIQHIKSSALSIYTLIHCITPYTLLCYRFIIATLNTLYTTTYSCNLQIICTYAHTLKNETV